MRVREWWSQKSLLGSTISFCRWVLQCQLCSQNLLYFSTLCFFPLCMFIADTVFPWLVSVFDGLSENQKIIKLNEHNSSYRLLIKTQCIARVSVTDLALFPGRIFSERMERRKRGLELCGCSCCNRKLYRKTYRKYRKMTRKINNRILLVYKYVTGPMKTNHSAAPHNWEIICGFDRVFYKLQNDTKNTVIAHFYRKLRSTNCLLVQYSENERCKDQWHFLWFLFISGFVKNYYVYDQLL